MKHYHEWLQELRHSEFQVVPGQPDITGWPIYDHAHKKVGMVHDLLFDPEARKVRYIIAALEITGIENGQQVLIPIGMAELHGTDDEVVLPDTGIDNVRRFSPYPYDALKNNAMPGSTIQLDPGDDHPHFDDQQFYRNRGIMSGLSPDIEAELKKDKTSVNTIGIRLRSRIIAGPSGNNRSDAGSEEP